MKKLRNLLVVATLLMVVGLVLPLGQVGSNPDGGVTVNCDLPPGEVIGLY